MNWFQWALLLVGACMVLVGGIGLCVHAWKQNHKSDDDDDSGPRLSLGWDETGELPVWNEAQRRLERTAQMYRRVMAEKEQMKCPHCNGTRCWDWKRNGRPCGDNPTTANSAAYLMGRHHPTTVELTVAGYWPLARTHTGRTNPHLFRKVAGHCAISLAGPRRLVPA